MEPISHAQLDHCTTFPMIPCRKLSLNQPLMRCSKFHLVPSFQSGSFAKAMRIETLVQHTGSVARATRIDMPVQESNFTASYLINSCGLAPEAADSLSKKLKLRSPEKSDAVLTLLRNHGFSEKQITKLVTNRPWLLLAKPEVTLLPKLKFLQSIGVPNTVLAIILSKDPSILTRSLEKQIIPSYNFLKSVLLSDAKVVTALKRSTWIFLDDPNKNVVPNLEVLREIGTPDYCISLLLTHFPAAMFQKKEAFRKIVEKVKELGFDPTKSTFVLAIRAMSGKGKKSIYNQCKEVYRSWGWTEDDILLAFKKHPHCMVLSEKKITETMEFLVNKMGWPSRMIATCPVVLFYRLEERIKPRCSVVRALQLKGLVKKNLSLYSVLLPHEEGFMDTFVMKYIDKVPELLSVYRGELDFDAYNDGWTALNWVISSSWLQSNKDKKVHVYLAGDSSGGNIVHHVALRAVDSGIQVMGNILLNPMFGGKERTESEIRFDGKYFVTIRDRDWYWRAFLPEGEDRDHPACNPFGPRGRNLKGIPCPKSLVVVAGLDLIQDWQLAYVKGLKEAGQDVKLLFLEQATIGFYLLPNNEYFSIVMDEIRSFLRSDYS